MLTFKLQRKLPYKRMLIVTGVLLAVVLVVMVGTTVRTLQGVGWLPITPIDADPMLGTWFGIFPTWESIGAQVAALVFVIGSYFAAEEVRVKRPRAALSAAPATPLEPSQPLETEVVSQWDSALEIDPEHPLRPDPSHEVREPVGAAANTEK